MNHIWVSDELLADTLRRFSKAHLRPRRPNAKRARETRYVHSAPGPLEAQRRLARRRFNYSAAAGQSPAGALTDTAVTIGWFDRLWERPLRQEYDWKPPWLNQPDVEYESGETISRRQSRLLIYDRCPPSATRMAATTAS